MTVRRMVGEARDAAVVGVVRLGLGLRLRGAIVAGMVLALVASFGAGGLPPWIVPTLLGLGAVVTALRPDTHVGLAAMFVFGWYWLAHVDADASPWTVLAAAGLMLFHLATSAAALGPAELDLPGQLLIGWARRSMPILGGTAGLWLLTALLSQVDAASNIILTAAAIAVVAAGGWLALTRSVPADTTDPSTVRRDART